MTLRARLTLVAAGVVAVVVSLASVTTYFVMRHELEAQLDGSLRSTAHSVQVSKSHRRPWRLRREPGRGGRRRGQFRRCVAGSQPSRHRRSLRCSPSPDLPTCTPASSAIRRPRSWQSGLPVRLREYVAPVEGGGAVLVVKSLSATDRALERLRVILILVSLGAIGAAAVAAAAVSGATLAPVRRLRDAAERIAETGEPSERVPEGGHDELGGPRCLLQHDARRARGVARDAAAFRRRCLARAAHAADEPADEHRRPAGRHRARPGSAQALARRSPSRVAGDARADRGPARACAERRPGGQGGRSSSTSSSRARSTGRAAGSPQSGGRPSGSSRRSSTATPTGWSGPSGTCSRTPASGAATAARSRSRSPEGSCGCATTGRVSPTRTGLSSSTASTGRRRPARCPAPGSASRSFARWPKRTAARSRPRTPATAERSCA